MGAAFMGPPAWDEGLQEVINGFDVPRRFTRPKVGIDVVARVVWERDGEELVETSAVGWTRDLVLVQLQDRRSQFRGVWVRPRDVRRR